MYQRRRKNSATNLFYIKLALRNIIHQLQICKQKTTKILPFWAYIGRKPNTHLSVICPRPKLSNLSYYNFINFSLDENSPSEAILPNDRWENGYRSDIEVEKGMTRATKDASDRERNSTDGKSRFLRTSLCRPIPLSECAVEVKIARKTHGKRRSKKNLGGLNEVIAPGAHILKVSPTTSTIRELE